MARGRCTAACVRRIRALDRFTSVKAAGIGLVFVFVNLKNPFFMIVWGAQTRPPSGSSLFCSQIIFTHAQAIVTVDHRQAGAHEGERSKIETPARSANAQRRGGGRRGGGSARSRQPAARACGVVR